MEKVMLCFSHSHSSPNDSATSEYSHFVCDQVCKAVVVAQQTWIPVQAAWGNADTEIGLNRRKGGALLDRRIGILKLCEAESGTLRLLILRLTAHGNVLKEDNYLISPDYFGTVWDQFSHKYRCPIMVTQGAAGNVSPKYFKSAVNPPDANDSRFVRAENALDLMARTVLRDAAPVIAALFPREITRFSMYSRIIELLADVPSYTQATAIVDEAKAFCGIDGAGWLAEITACTRKGLNVRARQ